MLAAWDDPQLGIWNGTVDAHGDFNGKKTVPITVHDESTRRDHRQISRGEIHIVLIVTQRIELRDELMPMAEKRSIPNASTWRF
ncbi:MAG: hypothetical protein QHC78_18945 [Pigmentiphaga sp.]|uniref:hypothetical protein n=1 Tax=Pigmentiphaga sp. TaxID=1977564 RepID=UPI0029A9676B|nr:hypothetical protein [Pigmentiphaga sp.]MDX3907769.1 hypothetical protein [Pigmentiphaga sp.]